MLFKKWVGKWNSSWHGTRIERGTRLEYGTRVERGNRIKRAIVKKARGHGTQVSVELELSMKSNTTWKSNSACFFKKWQGGVELDLAWNSN